MSHNCFEPHNFNDNYRQQPGDRTTLLRSGLSDSVPRYSPHSHSIVLNHGSALIFQRKSCQRIAKHRRGDTSEFFALDFKHKFRRSEISLVSATIGIHRSILEVFRDGDAASLTEKRPSAMAKRTSARSPRWTVACACASGGDAPGCGSPRI